jgi:pyruvate kinase
MSEMFAFHATLMSNTLGTSICVFTRSGFMALLLSHYRPAGTIFAFTNEYVSTPLRKVTCNFDSILKRSSGPIM